MFRALRYRNYRLFFAGQGISLVGTWMQQIAMGWLVYRLTGSAFILGVVGFSSQIPTFLLSPFAGVLVDRHSRYRILVVTQVLAMLQAFILGALTLIGIIAVWHVIILGIFLGIVNSFDAPARQSFVIDMVEKKEMLGNAIALNSFMFNGARLIGPSVAGLVIAAVGEGICFILNGVSFFAVIGCLLAMNIKYTSVQAKKTHISKDLKEGFVYIFNFAPIRAILLLLSVISMMGMSYAVLMPVFAKDILHGGPHTLGFLMAAVGVGALFGTGYLASKRSILKLGRIIPISSIIFGAGLILFSFSHEFWLSFLILLFTGFGFMVHMASCNTVLQTITDDDKRGRVMSFYTMSFMGMAPLGSLLSGFLASRFGAVYALLIGGISCILASLLFARKLPLLRKIVHPIYEKIGGTKEIALGINTAVEITVPPED